MRRHGCTRSVWLVAGVAIKTPTVRRGWRLFLVGLVHNLNERRWKGADVPCITPVLWGDPLGAVLITRRAAQPRNFRERHLQRAIDAGHFSGTGYCFNRDLTLVNVGFIGRHLVLVDWA